MPSRIGAFPIISSGFKIAPGMGNDPNNLILCSSIVIRVVEEIKLQLPDARKRGHDLFWSLAPFALLMMGPQPYRRQHSIQEI